MPLFRRGLLELGLAWNELTDSDVEELVSAPGAERLVGLDLSFNQLTAAGARSLATSTRLCGLRWPNVLYNNINQDGVALLRERFGESIDCRFQVR